VNAQANLTTSNIGLQKALERLSSGYRINRSGDDAAGLVVANQYRSQVAVLTQGVRNAGDGLSTLQIQDGALNNIAQLLDRMSALATQSASASSTVDRDVLQSSSRTSSRKSTAKRRWAASRASRRSRCS
jgi:flagellin